MISIELPFNLVLRKRMMDWLKDNAKNYKESSSTGWPWVFDQIELEDEDAIAFRLKFGL